MLFGENEEAAGKHVDYVINSMIAYSKSMASEDVWVDKGGQWVLVSAVRDLLTFQATHGGVAERMSVIAAYEAEVISRTKAPYCVLEDFRSSLSGSLSSENCFKGWNIETIFGELTLYVLLATLKLIVPVPERLIVE